MVATEAPTPTGRLRNGTQLVADLPLPDGVSVSVHGSGSVHLHPDTQEARRQVMGSDVFRASAWDVDLDTALRAAKTRRRGLEIVVFRASEVTR